MLSESLAKEYEGNVREQIEQFLASNNPDPHGYMNAVDQILSDQALRDLAEQVVKKGIEVNTVENLGEIYPDWDTASIEHQQKLEFGRLYSQYAWILWKKNQFEDAFNAIEKAMGYMPLNPTPNDYLRLGAIEYDNGKRQQGWEHIAKALMMDTQIEHQDPGYRKAIPISSDF